MQILFWKKLSPNERGDVLARVSDRPNKKRLAQCKEIISQVQQFKDESLIQYTEKFDCSTIKSLELSEKEIASAAGNVSDSLKKAIELSYNNISLFHRQQIPCPVKVEVMPGVVCEKQIRPIERVGLYIPGGSAVLVSTVLMLGVPAQLADVPLKIVVCPPNKDGKIPDEVIYAGQLCGVNKFFRCGGAQAIAALAYGTETIPKVDKIYGPGNAWVTLAKQLVSIDPKGACIDLPAGPSELLVIADKSANPNFIAADLLSQAEHGIDSQVFCLCLDECLATQIQFALKKQMKNLPRRAIAKKSLKGSAIIVIDSLEEAISISNAYAPEHLILQIKNAAKAAQKITSAGSVFIGPWAPESVGDYASGTNHVLPTSGFAKAYSGLSVSDFCKQITFQSLNKKGLLSIAETVCTLAEREGLMGHANAIRVRLQEEE